MILCVQSWRPEIDVEMELRSHQAVCAAWVIHGVYIYTYIPVYIYYIYIEYTYNHIYIYTVLIHDFMLDFIHEFIWYLCMIDEIPWNSQWIPWWSWAPRWTHSASASCDDMRWPLEVTWGYSNSWMVYDGKSPWKNSWFRGTPMTTHDLGTLKPQTIIQWIYRLEHSQHIII